MAPTAKRAAPEDDRVGTEIDGRRLTLTRLDKVLFPQSGFTKGQLIDYYARIAPVLVPHVRDRPVTFHRYPDGVEGFSFYEKHVPSHAPSWVRTVMVPSPSSGKAGARTDGRSGSRQSSRSDEGADVEYAIAGDRPTLVWAANLASIELHVPLWHVGRRRHLPGPPDHLAFDLDPGPGATIVECCRVAGWIAEALTADGLDTFPKTSGSKGMQVYAPLPGRPTWDRTRERAHELAGRLEHRHPELVVSSMRKDVRGGKVLIDWSQNVAAKTTVAPYSVRARARPTVSTPISWDEVAGCADSGDPEDLVFTTDDVLARVGERGDLFAPVGLA